MSPKRVGMCIFLTTWSFCYLTYGAENDSISTKNRLNHFQAKIVEMENHRINSEIERVDELNKTRFTDLYIWIGIFVTLVTGGFILITINANNVAKKQAMEEVEKLSNLLETLENKAIKVEAQLEEAETKLKVFESLKNKENE